MLRVVARQRCHAGLWIWAGWYDFIPIFFMNCRVAVELFLYEQEVYV